MLVTVGNLYSRWSPVKNPSATVNIVSQDESETFNDCSIIRVSDPIRLISTIRFAFLVGRCSTLWEHKPRDKVPARN